MLLFAFIVSFFSMAAMDTTESIVEYTTHMDPLAMVDLALDLEVDLHLESVHISETIGDIIEIRTDVPI